jgi:FMN phosphatase YigB (HAD superfamily)
VKIPVICFDVDGVVADFHAGVRRELQNASVENRPEGWTDPERIPRSEECTEYHAFTAALMTWLWPKIRKHPNWWKMLRG